jgi:carbon-monoxide dehydrogenase large subunit
VGETGVIPVGAAVAGAIEDALAEFAVRIDATPILPSDLAARIAARRRA